MPDVSLAKEKVKIEKIHLVCILRHHITLGVVFSLLFFCSVVLSPLCVIKAQTDQEMQIIPVLKTSSDVIVGTVRGGRPARHIKGRV